MTFTVRAEALVFSSGARLRLSEPTLSCRWTFSTPPRLDAARTDWLRQIVGKIWPEEPLLFTTPDDWPGRFILPGSSVDGLAAWGVALTIAFQQLARDPVGQGCVLTQTDQDAHVALPYVREGVTHHAMSAALSCLAISQGENIHDAETLQKLRHRIERWIPVAQARTGQPNTFRFAMSAKRRGIPVNPYLGIIRLGWGSRGHKLDSSFTGQSSQMAARFARRKDLSMQLLGDAGLPVPPSQLAGTLEAAKVAAQALGYPVVIKPANLDQGLGVVPGIRDEAGLASAFESTDKLRPGAVMIEKHIEGQDHRLLVLQGRLLMATRRIPGGVTGDGKLDVRALLEQLNRDPRRGTSKTSLLMRISLDAEAEHCLAEQKLRADSVPRSGQFVHLRRTANISTGGTAIDVSDQIHPANRDMAERAARLLGVDLAGVDFLSPDISRPWYEAGGAICEVNAQPGFRPHWLSRPDRDINGEIIEQLFQGKPSRIPVIGLFSAKGRGAVALGLRALWRHQGQKGAMLSERVACIGDMAIPHDSSPSIARELLLDPIVDTAVFDLGLPYLGRHGHPCDRYHTVAWTPALPGLVDGEPSEHDRAINELALDAVIRALGFVVMPEAQWERWAALRARSKARWIMIGSDPDSAPLRHHVAQGGIGVVADLRDADGSLQLIDAQGIRRLTSRTELADRSGIKALGIDDAVWLAALAWTQGLMQQP